MANSARYSLLIKEEALRLGFDACGISAAGFLDKEAHRLDRWLESGMHGSMGYMANNFEKRVDPRRLVDGAKSVISLICNYYPSEINESPDAPVLSKYAYGEDYHHVIKKKLHELLGFINAKIGEVSGRAFVDSAPVMDKVWAAKSGLGWIGKNTCLITKKRGSFFFIGELIVDIELEADTPGRDHCGKCSLCIDSCPLGALSEPGVIDARRCISYLTIEYRGKLPDSFRRKMENRLFGCDICQDVCPWNKKAVHHNNRSFNAVPGLMAMTRESWQQVDREWFNRVFRRSAVKRAGYDQIIRNLNWL